MSGEGWIEVAGAAALEVDDMVRVDHEGRSFLVYRLEDGFFATDGYCTHERQHLEDGLVDDGVIECPLHMGQFDVRTGEALAGPVCIDLRTYETKVEDGTVFVRV